MKQRIKYMKTEKDGILKSHQFYKSESTGATYVVELDTNEATYRITNVNNRRVYRGGDGIKNLHVLKRKAKKRLEELGVSFSSETRDNSSREVGKNCAYGGKEE